MATTTAGHRSPNRLIQEKSPYLLQHAYNPVDWYAWGDDAFARARRENKPVFLSVGYATCHWCHVMAHESFEDEAVASLLNNDFVAVKVDREERPDIDAIYMSACQALTGTGGWPLSLFLTPEAQPFFAGTYFPKTGRLAVPGFIEVLSRIARLWKADPSRILDAAHSVTQVIQAQPCTGGNAEVRAEHLCEKAYQKLARRFDPRWGGFGRAPKFPGPDHLTFLLWWHRRSGDPHALEMVEKTLDAMRNGGIFDQIGFGFHRYSVDERWLVPHFEKMLYDQALLCMAYTEAFQATGKQRFARVAREILTYVLREMRAPEGGFFSAQDADSEGREGLHYLWTPEQVRQHVGEKAARLFCEVYGITNAGNFEDRMNIAHVHRPPQAVAQRHGLEVERLQEELENARRILFEARNRRPRPLKDDKVLTAWNGLMIAALARAAKALEEDAYAQAAERAATFVLHYLTTSDGRLLRRYRAGEAAYAAYLDDYAFFVWGLLELYEALCAPWVLDHALSLNEQMIALFSSDQGGLYFAGQANEPLIAKTLAAYDGAMPAGNSIAALNFLRLSELTHDSGLRRRALEVVECFSGQIHEQPVAHTRMLIAVDKLENRTAAPLNS